MNEEEEYRLNEEESRRMAERAEGEEDKKAWLRLAEWWKSLRERITKSFQ